MKPKMLVVDDNPEILSFYEDSLCRMFATTTALSGTQAVEFA